MAPARLAAALGASLLMHALLAALLAQIARGWQSGAPLLPGLTPKALMATLRAAPVEAIPIRTPSAPSRGPYDAATPGAPLPMEPVYYRARELDERPLALAQVEPVYPAEAPALAARVQLRLYVNEAGSVDRIEILDSGPGEAFANAARHAFAAARFRPGVKGGIAVKSQFPIEVLFGAAPPIDPHAQPSPGGENVVPANPNGLEAADRAAVKRTSTRPKKEKP